MQPQVHETEGDRKSIEELGEVHRCWKIGDWSIALSPYKLLHNDITLVGRLVMRGTVLLSLHERVLEFAHEGHQGIVITLQISQIS